MTETNNLLNEQKIKLNKALQEVSGRLFNFNDVKKFLELGADVNLLNGKLIKHLCLYRTLEEVKYVVENFNADFRIDNDTPIIHCFLRGHLDIAKYLYSKGADPTTKNFELLKKVARMGNLPFVQFLIIDCHIDIDILLNYDNSKENIIEWATKYKSITNLNNKLHSDLPQKSNQNLQQKI